MIGKSIELELVSFITVCRFVCLINFLMLSRLRENRNYRIISFPFAAFNCKLYTQYENGSHCHGTPSPTYKKMNLALVLYKE